MPKISHDDATCAARDWAIRLASQPQLLAKVLEMLDLVEGAAGDVRRADEAELRVIEILRETGNEVLTAWARRLADVATAEARTTTPAVGHAKKKFTGTRPTDP